MGLLDRSAIVFERLKPPQLILFFLVAALVKAGIWYIPNISTSSLLAADPFRNPFTGESQYLFTNWLGPWMAWMMHARSGWSFKLLHFVFSIVFLATNFVYARIRLAEAEWKTSICLFAVFPVFWTHMYWIGYDSITLSCMAFVIAFLSYPWLAFVFAVGVGLQHAQQGFVAFAVLFAIVLVERGSSVGHRRALLGPAAALGGVLVGRGVLQGIIVGHGILLDAGRSDYLVANARTIVGDNAYGIEVFLFGSLCVGWLPVVMFVRNDRRGIALLAALLVCMAVTFFTVDVTRVFAVISYPAIAYCLLYDARWLARVTSRQVVLVVLAWLFVPWLFVWQGRFRTTVFPYDAAVISHAIVGAPSLPDDRAYWPFLPMSHWPGEKAENGGG